MRSIIERGQTRRDIRGDIDPEMALELMAGPFLARVFAGLDTGPRWRKGCVSNLVGDPPRKASHMIQFTVETEIARPPSDVFAHIADPAKLATWQTNTISAVAEDDQPVGLGTRVREVHRAPGGKQLASLVEVSEYEPDRVFALRILEGPLPVHARIMLEPTELGTRVQLDAHGQLSGAMRLAQPLLGLTLKRQFLGYCTTLKHVLENAPSTM